MNKRLQHVISELSIRGILTPREMQALIGGSAATLSRMLAGAHTDRILRFGKTRATRYALKRNVRGMGSDWPLYRIAPKGDADVLGHLHALSGGRWLLQQESQWHTLCGGSFTEGIFPGLPWFLQDLRPRGFLGRLLAKRYSDEIGVPSDPRSWSDDDILVFLLTHGCDLPGNLVLGRRSLEAAQRHDSDEQDLIADSDRSRIYPQLADAMMTGAPPGSSAAGEQPKFTARVRRANGRIDSVIVKFCGAKGRPEDHRWRDLLIAEHVANAVLAETGVATATTTLIHSEGRCFLESSRFDRFGATGRDGFVSLEAFDAAYFGEVDSPWDLAGIRYRESGWLTERDAQHLALLWWFGRMIGNTDMHYGNAGLLLTAEKPLALAPVYDMTPMYYRPDLEGRLPSAPVGAVTPPPEMQAIGEHAARLAHNYWQRLARDASVSEGFRIIASANAAR